MMELTESRDFYVSQYGRVSRGHAENGPGWLKDLREKAIRCFQSLGFPTTRLEEWRYTNVSKIAQTAFQPAGNNGAGSGLDGTGRFSIPNWEGYEVVLVNGSYAAELSSVQGLPDGIKVMSLGKVLEETPELVEPYLGRYADFETHAFSALNTSLMEDGVVVWIAEGRCLERPLHLLFVTSPGQRPMVTHPRILVVLGKNSQGTFVESYLSVEEGVYFTNSVTEIVMAENAVAEHCKIQAESRNAFHVSTIQAHQDRNSSFISHAVSQGSALARQDLNVFLGGEGADCSLNGLYMVSGRQHVDHHTRIDHSKPHGTSREHYKGILAGRSTGVFNGKVVVWKEAQKTDAQQRNQNLLLSEGAEINSKPQLEILADDVKCAHGTAIGQIDPEALFYLRTRGLGEESARGLLTYGFAADALARVRTGPVRSWLEGRLLSKLRGGEAGG